MGFRACNRRNTRDINPHIVINDWVFNLTQLSENNTRSTSTKCKCKWLTLARAPGLLNPMRHRRPLNLARSDKEQSSATSFNTCGELVARSGHSRQWLRVSGLLLTRTVMRWSPNLISKRRSSDLILLKLKEAMENSGRNEVILCGWRRSVVRFSFNWEEGVVCYNLRKGNFYNLCIHLKQKSEFAGRLSLLFHFQLIAKHVGLLCSRVPGWFDFILKDSRGYWGKIDWHREFTHEMELWMKFTFVNKKQLINRCVEGDTECNLSME